MLISSEVCQWLYNFEQIDILACLGSFLAERECYKGSVWEDLLYIRLSAICLSSSFGFRGYWESLGNGLVMYLNF